MTWLERHSDAIVTAIVGDLAPAHPPLDLAERRSVVGDVGVFVASQVQRLPDFLRLPYRVALFAFEGLPILRWGRPFRRLDEGRRQAYLARWADSRLGAARNVVKLLRSCTLLAYYDHPVVRARLEGAAAASADAPLPCSSAGSV